MTMMSHSSQQLIRARSVSRDQQPRFEIRANREKFDASKSDRRQRSRRVNERTMTHAVALALVLALSAALPPALASTNYTFTCKGQSCPPVTCVDGFKVRGRRQTAAGVAVPDSSVDFAFYYPQKILPPPPA